MDHQGKFTNCFIGHPGCVHDARVYATSPIGNKIENSIDIMSGDDFLIGDAAYALTVRMMTPFRITNSMTSKQKRYNFTQSSARCVVERAFGIMKARFRRLQYIDSDNLEKIALIISAGCVLHNITFELEDKPNDIEIPKGKELKVLSGDPNECDLFESDDHIVVLGSSKEDAIRRRQVIMDKL